MGVRCAVELQAEFGLQRVGGPSDVAVLRVAAALASGHPVDLRNLAARLDKRVVGPVQLAISFATYDPALRPCGGPDDVSPT